MEPEVIAAIIAAIAAIIVAVITVKWKAPDKLSDDPPSRTTQNVTNGNAYAANGNIHINEHNQVSFLTDEANELIYQASFQ